MNFKNYKIFILFIACFISLFLVRVYGYETQDHYANTLTEERVKEIVIDVIKKNPKLLYEVISTYVREQQEKNELVVAFKHRISGIPINSYNPSIGPNNAPITIIEFTDFQCPFCKRASQTIDELLHLYPNKIRLVFKNLPLPTIHKHSLSAAKAAMAANKQGMFWPYYDMLFDNSPKLNKKLYINLARSLGLDIKRFKSDMKSDVIDKQIKSDIELAKKFGINATPTFVINGVLIKGARSIGFFKKVVDRLLKESLEAH